MPINIIKNSSSSGASTPITINGKTGTNITLSKSDIGLSAVVNAEQVKKTDIGVLVPEIQPNGKILVEQTPVIAANLVSVANLTERLALPSNSNLTICLQADTQWMWSLNANEDPSVVGNWIDCGSTATSVVTVNNASGAVTINCDNIGAVPVDRTINSKALNDNVTLTINDIVTLPNDGTKFLAGDGTWKTASIAGIATTEYVNAKPSTSVTTVNTDIPMTVFDGNISYANPYFTLKSGKTYLLTASVGFRGATYACYNWVDSTNTNLPNSVQGQTGALNSTDPLSPTIAFASITPTSDIQVKLRITSISGATGIDLTSSYIRIEQIGLSAIGDSITLNKISSVSTSDLNITPGTGKTNISSTKTTTPTIFDVRNKFTGQNGSGNDYEVSTINLGCDGFNSSISTKVPNTYWGDACRMDLCTPAGTNDNTQEPRVSIMPFTGNTGIGTTTPTAKLDVKGLTSDGSTKIISAKDSNGTDVFSVDTKGKIIGLSATTTDAGLFSASDKIKLDGIQTPSIAHFNKPFDGNQFISGIGTNLVLFPLNIAYQKILSGITFSDANDSLTIVTNGIYRISFIEYGNSGATSWYAHEAMILVNGISVAKGSSGSTLQRITNTVEYVNTLSAGDVITFKVKGVGDNSDIMGGSITVQQIR